MTWQTVLAIDNDRRAVETYEANVPGVEVRCAGVADEIGAMPRADIVIGGPPCQPHSFAGKRQASEDARDCGPDFVAAVRRVQPRMFLMENVPGLLSSERGRYWPRLFAAMEASGYYVEHKIQDAVSFGVPQFRKRLWVWGIRKGLYAAGMRQQWPKPTHVWPWAEASMFGGELRQAVTVRQALNLDGTINRRLHNWDGTHGREYSPDRPSMTLDSAGRERVVVEPGSKCRHDSRRLELLSDHAWSDESLAKHPPMAPASPASSVRSQFGKASPDAYIAIDKPCPTISAGGSETGGPEPIHNRKRSGFIRRLSPWECLRLQSGPDDFVWPHKMTKTAMYAVIGNGFACAHAHAFALAFATTDPEAMTIIDLFCGGGLAAVGWHGRFWKFLNQEQSNDQETKHPQASGRKRRN